MLKDYELLRYYWQHHFQYSDLPQKEPLDWGEPPPLVETKIENYSYTRMDENNIAIWVVCNPIISEINLAVDGNPLPTTVGEEFISALYPFGAHDPAQSVQIKVQYHQQDASEEKPLELINTSDTE